MKLNDNFSNKNDFIYLNKFDFSKNDSFGLPNQSKNLINNKEYNKNYNESNADPRLELTLKYLDIISTLPTFITNNIFFNDLLLLSKNDLVELGFSLVERNRILHFSQEFKKYGKKYSIQEINNFFNEFQNLNMRLITINNNNNQSFPTNEKNEIINNINNERLSNNQKSNYNFLNYDKKNNSKVPNSDSLYLEDKPYPINHNDFYPKSYIFPGKYINKNQLNKNNYNFQNNDIKVMNNFLPTNIKNKNIKAEQKYQESIYSNINQNNINNHNYQEIDTSKLIRQNSKTSKTSSYSKNSKSRLVTLSKNFLPLASSSGSIVQKYQNLSEEIDNYFKKYNNHKENKKNKMKKYQIITSSNNSKKNYNPIFINNKNFLEKKKNNNNSINNVSNFNNNYKENEINDNINNEISQKLQELQKKKKELKEKLNTVCDNENKKKVIVKYLEEEEDK